MNNSNMNEIVNNMMAILKKDLVNRIARMNPVEAMKITAKDLVDCGFPVDKAVVTVKALLIQIGKELDLPHPFSDADIEEMKRVISK